MERSTDWTALWRELAAAQEGWLAPAGSADPWQAKAHDFDARSQQRWSQADPLRDFVASKVTSGDTLLDIGAGTGQWTVLLAERARRITAVEPSPSMTMVLRRRLAEQDAGNVRVVEGYWPDVSVEPHDVALCAHAMYFTLDLPAFIQRMIDATRRLCCLVLRLPAGDGVMAEAAVRIWGQPHDSPNFVVAYNALLQMGLRPNVLVDPAPWRPWVSTSLDEALAKIKRRFRIAGPSEHDEFLRRLLARRLTLVDGQYVWPIGVYSALVYWRVD